MGPGHSEDGAAADRDIVFVSYCHVDLHWVQRFQVLLKPLLRRRRLQLWADTAIVGAQEWHPAIEQAITRSALGLLLVSGDFLASDYIMDRELPALLAHGVPLAPVLIGSCFWDEVPELARVQWLHDPGRDGPLNLDVDHPGRRDERLVKVCRELLGTVPNDYRAPAPSTLDHGSAATVAEVPAGERQGALHGVPARPRGYVEREELTAVITSVLATDTGGAVGLTTEPTALGLHGQGGIGKSVLLAALGRDERIRNRFPDGIYWITVGERTDALALQLDLLARLGRDDASPRTVADATAELADALSTRRVLLLVDDVWSDAAAYAFRVTGPRGRVVYTARDRRVIESVGALPCVIGFLSVEAARAVAAGVLDSAPSALPAAADHAFAEVDRVALAVALLSAAVRGGRSWDDLAGELRRGADIYGDHPYSNTFKAMQIAVAALPGDLQAALLRLAVFPPDTAVPVAAVKRYWAHTRGYSDEDTTGDLKRLATASVLIHERGQIVFHDLQHDFLLLHAPALATLHADLLDAYRALLPSDAKQQWWQLPTDEPYMWDHLVHHLRGAGERRAALTTVTDPIYLTIRIGRRGVHAAEADLAAAQEVADSALPVLEWWQAWLRRHTHLLRGLVGESAAVVAPTVLVWLRADPTRPAIIDTDRLLPLMAPHHLTPRWCRPPSTLLVRVLAGHSNSIGQIAWSPDGTQLAAADDDWEIRVWDIPIGRTTATLIGHTSEIKTVVWDPDGQLIYTVAEDWEIRTWDASGRLRGVGDCRPSTEDARRLLANVENDADEVANENASPAWTQLASWGFTSERREGIGYVVAAVWAPDTTQVAIATDLGHVWIWHRVNAVTTAVLLGSGDDILALAWSPDGTRLATAGSDRDVVVWDPTTGRTVVVLTDRRPDRGRRQKTAISLAWAPDSRRITGTGFGDAFLTWDIPSGHVVSTKPVDARRKLAVAWSPDGTRIAAVGSHGTAQVWNHRDGQLVTSLRGHAQALLTLAWSPDGTYLATAGRDREIRVWAPAAITPPSPITPVNTDAVVSVEWSPDGRQLATVESDSSVRIWDNEAGRLRAEINGIGGPIVAVSWSPDARRLATAGPYRLARIWDIASRRSIATFTGHSAQVVSVAWCPDNKRVASAGLDGEAHIWHAETGGLLVELVGHSAGVSCVAWSPDGHRLATASLDGDAWVWASHNGQSLTVLQGHADWLLRAVAWSPDGRQLATGGDDRELRLWNPVNGHEEARIGGHDSSIVALAWSPDGRAIASCDSDGVLLVQALDHSYTHRLQLESATCVAWTGSGIAVGRTNSVAVLDVH